MWVELGNDSHLAQRRDEEGKIVAEAVEGQYTTRFDPGPGYSIQDCIDDITRPGGVLSMHFVQGARPAWIESDIPELKSRLAAVLGLESNTRRPASWGAGNQSP